MSVKIPFSAQQLLDIGAAGYLHELHLLVRTLGAESTDQILPLFKDYIQFLRCDLGRVFPIALRQRLLSENDGMIVSEITDCGKVLFDCANLAAACEVFHGWTIDASQLTHNNSAEFLQENIRFSGLEAEQLGRIMGIRLNRADALRTAQILKLLGLVSLNADDQDQLALGAALAHRDREGFHRIPGIGPENPGAEFSRSSPLNFAVKSCTPNSLVIIDNDSQLDKQYAELNRRENSDVQALNLDLYEGLDRLAELIRQGQCKPRNLVTQFRLEPDSLPDVPLFIQQLFGVIDDSAAFLVTIGAGNTQSEFIARQQTLDELAEQLRAQGLQPVRIILHSEQAQSTGKPGPVFGLSEYASFEILFCQCSPPGQRRRGQGRGIEIATPVPELNPQLWNSFLPSNRMTMVQGLVTFLHQQGRLAEGDQTVLNLGAGLGETSACLEQVLPNFSVTDVDQLPYRRESMHRSYLQANVASLPIRDRAYEVLFSSFTFSYLGSSRAVMTEWLRILKPGGRAYFVFHAPHSAYLKTAREMLSQTMARDFFQLLPNFKGRDFDGLYDWCCQQNYAWKMAFEQECEFLSYAHEIQVCRHLVEHVAELMFHSPEQIYEFFAVMPVQEVSVNVIDQSFNVKTVEQWGDEAILGWFVVLTRAE